MKLPNLDWEYILEIALFVAPALIGLFWIEHRCYHVKIRELEALKTQLKTES
jgi:hypothetical protein